MTEQIQSRLYDAGWIVECVVPLEIRSRNDPETFATRGAAQLVVDSLLCSEQQNYEQRLEDLEISFKKEQSGQVTKITVVMEVGMLNIAHTMVFDEVGALCRMYAEETM